MAKHKSKRKRIALIVAVLVVAGLGVWYVTRAKSSSTAKKTTPTTTETKQTASTESTKTDATIDKDAPAKTETASATDSSNKTLYIVVNRPVNNDSIMLADGIALRSTITGATSGTCTLALVGPGDKTVSKSTSIAAQPSYGSCSFDVTGSELTMGDWNLTLTATSGSSTGKATLKVTVK